jgi:hypothetical protein
MYFYIFGLMIKDCQINLFITINNEMGIIPIEKQYYYNVRGLAKFTTSK